MIHCVKTFGIALKDSGKIDLEYMMFDACANQFAIKGERKSVMLGLTLCLSASEAPR